MSKVSSENTVFLQVNFPYVYSYPLLRMNCFSSEMYMILKESLRLSSQEYTIRTKGLASKYCNSNTCLIYNYRDVGFAEFKAVGVTLRKIMFASEC